MDKTLEKTRDWKFRLHFFFQKLFYQFLGRYEKVYPHRGWEDTIDSIIKRFGKKGGIIELRGPYTLTRGVHVPARITLYFKGALTFDPKPIFPPDDTNTLEWWGPRINGANQ